MFKPEKNNKKYKQRAQLSLHCALIFFIQFIIIIIKTFGCDATKEKGQSGRRGREEEMKKTHIVNWFLKMVILYINIFVFFF